MPFGIPKNGSISEKLTFSPVDGSVMRFDLGGLARGFAFAQLPK